MCLWVVPWLTCILNGAKCWSVENEDEVFEKMPLIDVLLWTSMIAGYVQNDREGEAHFTKGYT